MKNADKKKLAKELYITSSKTQKEIAKQVGVTQKTMSMWCKDWVDQKAAHLSTKDETVNRLRRAIVKIIESAEQENREVSDSEADKISKLNKAITDQDKKLDLRTYIQIFKEFNSFMLQKDVKLSQTINKFQDEFINIKASGY